MQSLLPRVATADRQLNGLLAEGLTASLEQNASSAWRHCLVAFAAIGNTASAEQVGGCQAHTAINQLRSFILSAWTGTSILRLAL